MVKQEIHYVQSWLETWLNFPLFLHQKNAWNEADSPQPSNPTNSIFIISTKVFGEKFMSG